MAKRTLNEHVLSVALRSTGLLDAHGVATAARDARLLPIGVVATAQGFLEWAEANGERVLYSGARSENAIRITRDQDFGGLLLSDVVIAEQAPPNALELYEAARTRVRAKPLA